MLLLLDLAQGWILILTAQLSSYERNWRLCKAEELLYVPRGRVEVHWERQTKSVPALHNHGRRTLSFGESCLEGFGKLFERVNCLFPLSRMLFSINLKKSYSFFLNVLCMEQQAAMGPPGTPWPAWGCHCNKLACSREMGQEEKQSDVCTVERRTLSVYLSSLSENDPHPTPCSQSGWNPANHSWLEPGPWLTGFCPHTAHS